MDISTKPGKLVLKINLRSLRNRVARSLSSEYGLRLLYIAADWVERGGGEGSCVLLVRAINMNHASIIILDFGDSYFVGCFFPPFRL
jgi:hypothetical protein